MRNAMISCGRVLLQSILVASLLVAPGAFAQTTTNKAAPVALVMQLTGTTNPPLARHREVGEGTKIALGPKSSLTLLHYGACSIVTLSGGTATVTADNVVAAAANVESTKPGPCPRVHKIALDGRAATGGVSLSRSVPTTPNSNTAPLNFSANGVVVLSGAGASKATSYELRDGFDRVVAQAVPVRDGTFTLDGTARAHGPYTIRVYFVKGIDPVNVPVFLRSNDGGTLVLRTD